MLDRSAMFSIRVAHLTKTITYYEESYSGNYRSGKQGDMYVNRVVFLT